MMVMGTRYLYAQKQPAVFNNSHMENYHDNILPNNQVVSFNFDAAGYLWIETIDGISRFDGHYFKNDFGSKITNRFPAMQVFSYLSDTSCVFWGKKIFKIFKGNITGSDEYSFKKYGTIITNLQNTSFMFNYMKENELNEFWKRENWLYFNGGCFAVTKGADTLGVAAGEGFKIYVKGHLLQTLPFADSLSFETKDNVQFFTDGAAIINKKSGKLDIYLVNGEVKHESLPAKAAACKLYRGQNSRTFFMAANKTLYEVGILPNEKRLEYRKMLDNFIDTVDINIILNKDDRLLIMGSVYKGIYIYRKNYISILTAPKAISRNFFYAQALMPDGKTRLTGGRLKFDSSGFKGMVNEESESERKNAEKMNNGAFLADSKGFHWFFKYVGDKLCLFKGRFPKDGKALKIADDFGEAYCLYEDEEENIWVQKRSALGYFEKGTSHYVQVTPAEYDTRKVLGKLHAMAEDNEGNLLFGISRGVYKLKKGELNAEPRLHSLEGSVIFDLKANKKKDLGWAGANSGFFVIDRTGEFHFVSGRGQYGQNSVVSILTDRNQLVWISSSIGVFVTTKQSLTAFAEDTTAVPFLYHLSEKEGLSAGLTGGVQYSAILSTDGHLSISTEGGLAWMNVNNFANPFPATSFFLELEKDSVIKVFADNEVLHLKHSENKNISFSVSFADWNAENNIETGYKFINKNDNDSDTSRWNKLTIDNKIIFPSLPAGNSILRVRKRTGFGANDYRYISITISIPLHWYETKWFYAGLWLLGLSLIAFIAYTRNRLLKRANQRLNIKINNATSELAEKNNELAIKNQELATYNETKNKMLSLFSHDISVPLFYINLSLSQIVSNKGFYELPPELVDTISTMENTTSDLNVLMNDILYWIQIQQGNIDLQITSQRVNVKNVINKILKLFHFRIAGQKMAVNVEIDEQLTIVTDERLFTSILYNVLSNAIKFAHTGFFNIGMAEAGADKNEFTLIFENSIDRPGKADAINEAIHSTGEEQGHVTQSRGIGLTLVEDFANRLGLTVRHHFGDKDTFILVIKGAINKPQS
jgi:signal transduction histidine kinase